MKMKWNRDDRKVNESFNNNDTTSEMIDERKVKVRRKGRNLERY